MAILNFKKKERSLGGAYGATFFLNFGLGLLGIFVPVYIRQVTGQIKAVFAFYALLYGAVFLFSPLAAWFLKKFFSPDGAYFFSVIGRLAYLAALYLLPRGRVYFYLAALLWGAVIPFCWFPFFLTVVQEKKGRGFFGYEVSLMGIIAQLAAALAPVISGIVIARWGFLWAYFLAGIFFLLSFWPLYRDHYHPQRVNFSLRRALAVISDRREKKLVRAFVGSGLLAAANIAWPLYIFSSLGTYRVLGWIKGVSLFLSILILLWAGRRVDEKKGEILNWGVGLGVINWLVRILARTGAAFFFFDFWANIAGILVNTPFQALIYQKARRRFLPAEFFLAQNLVVNGSAFLALLLLTFLASQPYFWEAAFFLGAVGTFLIKGNDGHQVG